MWWREFVDDDDVMFVQIATYTHVSERKEEKKKNLDEKKFYNHGKTSSAERMWKACWKAARKMVLEI